MSWPEHSSTWAERHRLAVDLIGICVLAAALVPFAQIIGTPGTTRSGHATAAAFALLAPLAWRRVRPVPSTVTVYVVGLALLRLDHPLLVPGAVAVLVSLYSVTVYGPRWAHRTAVAGAAVGVLVAARELLLGASATLSTDSSSLVVGAFGVVMVLAVWAFGLLRRVGHERTVALRDRAERLEVERDQQTRLATAAERTRIARELHDIVAHSLSVMIAQADGGRYAAPADPGAAVRSLETVSETGRAALADMRRLLGVLREDDGSRGPRADDTADRTGSAGSVAAPRPTGTDAGGAGAGRAGAGRAGARNSTSASDATGTATLRAPQPGMGGLDALVAQVRDSGPRVSLVRVGVPRELPPGAGLTIYRVAQEALTNVLKHAGPAPRVTVLVRWDPTDLVLDVQDDGRGAGADPSAPAGYGLLGMRERAEVFGGTVAAGPRPGGGFRVTLVLPTTYLGARTPDHSPASVGSDPS